jgi:hypothetical protein
MLTIQSTVSSLRFNSFRLISQTLKSNHLVGLVEDKDTNHPWIKDVSLGNHVDDGTRCPDEDMSIDLDPSLPGSGHGEMRLDLGELSDLVDNFLDLSRQFSGRSKTDCLPVSSHNPERCS